MKMIRRMVVPFYNAEILKLGGTNPLCPLNNRYTPRLMLFMMKTNSVLKEDLHKGFEF